MEKRIMSVCLLLTMLISIGWAANWRGTAVAPNTQSGWAVALDTGLVKYSPDCGLNWVDQSFVTPRYFFDIFFLNSQKGWIGGNEGFIFYTPNAGQNWYRQAMGLSKWAARVFFINDTVGWAACGEAIVAKTVSGSETTYSFSTWDQAFLPNPPFSADSCDIYGIHFIDENRGWFCAGRYPEYDAVAGETLYTKGQGYIARTTDGGANPLTWQLLRRDTIYDFFDIHFIDSLHGWVVGGNDRTMSAVIMKTQDGGLNWQSVTIPTQAKYLRGLKFIGSTHAWAVGRNGTILHTSNSGNTWVMQQSYIDTTLFDVDFGDTLHGLIAGNGYVLYTHNGGANWHFANMAGIEEMVTNPLS
ncbi:MAG: hypothetical protein KGZ86_03500, partial [Candidatus Latescibacteria bacterium]|nr:hypothetical protein [Candidatus Latescibacterota bacterium]